MGALKVLPWLIIGCALIVCAASTPDNEHRPNHRYFNVNFHFCVDIPSTWSYGESYTRNGATLAPKDKQAFLLPPRINVGAHANQPSENDGRPQTLDENIQSVVTSLREYASATDIQIIKTEDLTLQGLPARVVTLQYRDSQSHEQWFLKDLNLIDQRNIVYFLELKCQTKDAVALSAVFDSMVKSLRLGCKYRHQPSAPR